MLAMTSAMPLVNPTTTGLGMKRTAKSEEAGDDEDDAGHHGAHEEAVHAVPCHDRRNHNDKGAGGAAYRISGSAECRNEKTCGDGAVDARLGRQPRRDGKCHGQRQGHEADGDACQEVVQKRAARIIAQALDCLWQPLSCPIPHRVSPPFPGVLRGGPAQ